ncbi:MAG: N-acetyltransferase [Campylobacterota bacterium]|nr:N-acetyltransferase [Campylobacterota bacterium]
MAIKYRKALLADIPAMQQLVAPEVESGVILMRSDNEIATNIRSYHLAVDDEKLIGFVALHIHTPQLAEVRSLIIDLDYRSKAIGSALVKHALTEAKALGLKEILALTYHREFFEKMGFEEIPKESLPEHKIWADCIKCKHFPVCNEISLIKQLF